MISEQYKTDRILGEMAGLGGAAGCGILGLVLNSVASDPEEPEGPCDE